jgi:hypothetical protein
MAGNGRLDLVLAADDNTFPTSTASGSVGGESCAAGRSVLDGSRRLWSLWDMLQSYFPIYEIALRLQKMRTTPEILNYLARSTSLSETEQLELKTLFEDMERVCAELNFVHTADLTKAISSRALPKNSADMHLTLTNLDDSFKAELNRESVFRIPSERKGYYDRDDLFGPAVATAFPSCARDIRQAGNCYAFGQEDACVHHLMLVLERGLYALAIKVEVPCERANWQNVINDIGKKLKTMLRGPEREFYEEINSQFGFLKVAYRNHSEHSREDRYDMPKALHILNHVKEFMTRLASRCAEEESGP